MTTTYDIRVDRHLDDHWSPRLGDATIRRNADGTSTVTVRVVDQAQRHAVLTGLHDLNIGLVSLASTLRSSEL